MLGVAGILRWAIRPLDKLWIASAAMMGTALTAPLVVMSSVKHGRRRAFSTFGLWESCTKVPFFGRYAFAGLVHLAAPYTASINPMLTTMTSDYAEGYLLERPWLHNPFNSVHAVAMTNLGEYVSGILVTSQIEQMTLSSQLRIRGIVTGLSTTYHKKARGRITARCHMPELPLSPGSHNYEVVSELFDDNGVNVATTIAQWIVDVQQKSPQ